MYSIKILFLIAFSLFYNNSSNDRINIHFGKTKNIDNPECSAALFNVTNNSFAAIIWNLKADGCNQTFSNAVRILPGHSLVPLGGFPCVNKTITVKIVGPFNHIDMVTSDNVTQSLPYDINTPSGAPGYYTLEINNCLSGVINLY